MHNGVITILPTGFPPADRIPERDVCPQEKAALAGGCQGEGIPSSLGESRAGREAGCPEGVRPARKGAHPGNKGGRWRLGSQERD